MADKKEKKYLIDNPTLMAEWNWEKNNELGLFPDKLTSGSSKKAWWKCNVCAFEWQTKISHRSNGTGCKNCLRKKLTIPNIDNNLFAIAPDLCLEWNYEKNKESPNEFCVNSNKKVWWKCKRCQHEWQASISHRYSRKQGCPVCSNHKIIFGVNDLFSINPELRDEWDFEKNRLLNINPQNLASGSHKKVWWKCKKCGYEWQSMVYTRTKKYPQGCPSCVKEKQSSFPEKIVFFYLKKFFSDIVQNQRFDFLANKELDIYIPSIRLGVEYDGQTWHKSFFKDLEKDELCKKYNITLIRIREKGCPQYESSAIKIDVMPSKNDYSFMKEILEKIIDIINKEYNRDIKLNFNLVNDYNLILTLFYTQIKEKSITTANYFSEWNYERNLGINPKYITIFSNKKFWWKCEKGHEWEASPAKRSMGRNCPYCSNQKVLDGYNDLAHLYSNIAKEWDYEKNTIKPNEVSSKTNKKFWWICVKCGFSWKASVYTRTIMGCGCPNCKKNKISISSSKKVVNIDTKEIFDSLRLASKSCGVCASAISNCCRGVSKTAGGYHWGFVND